jgi:hypothetical protein
LVNAKAMHPDLKLLDLESIRNLFLDETRQYFIAFDHETPEELRVRKERIKEIEMVLEEKKKTYLTAIDPPHFNL